MQHSVSASNHCNSHVHGYDKKAYILKYLLDFKNLINIGCTTLSPFYDVYNFINCQLIITIVFWVIIERKPQYESGKDIYLSL